MSFPRNPYPPTAYVPTNSPTVHVPPYRSSTNMTMTADKQYSMVVVQFINKDTPDEEFMIEASIKIAPHLTEIMSNTGWLTLRNATDSRSINASLIHGFTLRAVTDT